MPAPKIKFLGDWVKKVLVWLHRIRRLPKEWDLRERRKERGERRNTTVATIMPAVIIATNFLRPTK